MTATGSAAQIGQFPVLAAAAAAFFPLSNSLTVYVILQFVKYTQFFLSTVHCYGEVLLYG